MYIPKWTHAYYNILIDIMVLPGVCMPSRMRRHHVYFALTGTTGRRFLRFSHILTTSFPETQAPPTSLRPCLRRLISTSDMWPIVPPRRALPSHEIHGPMRFYGTRT
ncbi:hypothetical protein ARMSODRAFT_323764 [Armillaria solidipes]|uniref:Uncharacterized protein n=1 Tax=Armillaria solidipes TaxID=1076256 RepID=A0A2H3BEA1_9AGAR|nr:hypothetical protein ARMSODRAFT_323764 [Armillaria solidipes]